MDLTLALGFQTVDALLRSMTARELGQWETYARRFLLPQRRLEMQLANIARMSAGSSDLMQFMFDPRMTPKPMLGKATGDDAVNAVVGIFGGSGIVRLGAVPMGQERKASNG